LDTEPKKNKKAINKKIQPTRRSKKYIIGTKKCPHWGLSRKSCARGKPPNRSQ